MDRRLRFRHRARTTKSARATGLAGLSAAPEMPRCPVQAQADTIRNMALRLHEVFQRFSSIEKEFNAVEQQAEEAEAWA